MYKLAENIKNDIQKYKDSLKHALSDTLSMNRFKGIRVPWGIYSHRGGQVYMNRVRIPGGVIRSDQLRILGKAAEKYGEGRIHVTTRQDIQLHNVKLENTPAVLDMLKDFDLCPRGGGGNTVRNVTACKWAGICPDEVTDVRGYAVAITERLLQQESSFNLPRKFKIAFSGCKTDCAGALVHDIGFIAREKEGKKGFSVYVGGGMGSFCRVADKIEDFITESDIPYYIQATKNVYHDNGNRKDKHHNRLRFYIEKIGIEKFKEQFGAELGKLKSLEEIKLRKVDFPEGSGVGGDIPRHDDDSEYKDFLTYNVKPQKQKGFQFIELRIPRGDICCDEVYALSDLDKEFPGIGFSAAPEQNLIITWVKNKDVYDIFLRLKKILKKFLYPGTLLDIVACKGALTCNLGLCHSPGLSEAIEDMVEKEFINTPGFKKLEIRLNGCPNSCGQQPLGRLSFHGLVKKIEGNPVPHYKFFMGGRKAEEKTKYGTEIGRIPSKQIPNFIKELVTRFNGEVDKYDDIYDFIDGPGRDIAKEVIDHYAYVPPISENKELYIDWAGTEQFSLKGIGKGECSTGVVEMIEADLNDAKYAREFAEKEGFSPKRIRDIMFYSARALLVVKGKEPKTIEETFSDFKESFIAEGEASGEYNNVNDLYKSTSDMIAETAKKEKYDYAVKFYRHIHELYDNMDPTFSFPKLSAVLKADDAGLKEKEKTAEIPVLDLKGTPCPINYVKAKIYLEGINAGSMVEIILDEGAPIENVPRSLENDGHTIVKTEKKGNLYSVIVEKK